jgi:predicted TIM-barrel fold metal-dependent hydrolase
MPQNFYQRLKAAMTGPDYLSGMLDSMPELADMDRRIAIMDDLGVDQQVITLSSPPLEIAISDPVVAAELARVANDEIAAVAANRPDRFIPVGIVAMNNPEAMVTEAERCLTELGMKGVLIYTSAKGKPLDLPEFKPFFELMAKLDAPIWLHPARGGGQPDYAGEDVSKYWIWQVFGWPYETTAAMTRLVFDGIFDRHPDIKIITHHAGAMLPFFDKRVEWVYDRPGLPELVQAKEKLRLNPSDYFRMFYNDTALMGSIAGMQAAYAFFGSQRLLFGTDTPFDGLGGEGFTADTLKSIDAMPIPPAEREAIYSGNLQRLIGS